jgi:hypothetical protein
VLGVTAADAAGRIGLGTLCRSHDMMVATTASGRDHAGAVLDFFGAACRRTWHIRLPQDLSRLPPIFWSSQRTTNGKQIVHQSTLGTYCGYSCRQAMLRAMRDVVRRAEPTQLAASVHERMTWAKACCA